VESFKFIGWALAKTVTQLTISDSPASEKATSYLLLSSLPSIIASNTSSIPADRICSKMDKPEWTSIIHFFAPVWRSLPVEVISWERGSQEALDCLFWFFAQTGKAPIITDNAICFILDRIFDIWCNESAFLPEGATAGQIDKVAESRNPANASILLDSRLRGNNRRITKKYSI